MLIIDKLVKLRVQRFLTIVTWTCWGGRSVVLTGVETKLKIERKEYKKLKVKTFHLCKRPRKTLKQLAVWSPYHLVTTSFIHYLLTVKKMDSQRLCVATNITQFL